MAMLLTLIGKQLKMLARNKQPLIILLLMPVVLITILSTALAGVMDNAGEPAIQAKLVIMEEANWEQEGSVIKNYLQEQGISGSAIDVFKDNDPLNMLESSILASEEMSNYIKVEKRPASELESVRQDTEIDGILFIPANYHLNYIKHAYFHEKSTPEIDLFLSQENEIRATIIQSVIEEWQNGYTKSLAISDAGIAPNQVMKSERAVKRVEQEIEGNQRKIPASIYYTLGMLVMFALYIPSFLSGLALQELQWKVYDRLLLAGVSATAYAVSVFCAGAVIAIVQQVIILLFGKFVLRIDWIGLEGLSIIVFSYSLFIGALSALMTTLQLRVKSEGIGNIFTGLIVSVFSFLGGSFFNLSDVSSVLADIGNFTPNGAVMSAILFIQKGRELEVIWPFITVLFVAFSLCVLLAIAFFPKRGVST